MRGIIFTGDNPRLVRLRSVQQTRRTGGLEVINLNPDEWSLVSFEPYKGSSLGKIKTGDLAARFVGRIDWIDEPERLAFITPRYRLGEVLYIKEAWLPRGNGTRTMYRCDYDPVEAAGLAGMYSPASRWNSPMLMPEKHSRGRIQITDIRAERVRDISDADCYAEGVPALDACPLDDPRWCRTCLGQGVHPSLGDNYGVTEVDCSDCDTLVKRFRNMWTAIHGPDSWDRDWCFPYTFRRVE